MQQQLFQAVPAPAHGMHAQPVLRLMRATTGQLLAHVPSNVFGAQCQPHTALCT